MTGKRARSLREHLEIYEKVYDSVYSEYPSLDDHALTVYYRVPEEVRRVQLEIRRPFFDDIYRRIFGRTNGYTVLDCGCGEGLVVERIHEVCSSIHEFFGNDISKTLVQQAKNRLRGFSFYPIQAPAEDLPFPNGRFDIVLSSHMIEHTHDPESAMREMARVLRPGGLLLLIAPREEWRDPLWGFPLFWPLVRRGMAVLSSRRERMKDSLGESYTDEVDRSLEPPDRAMKRVDLEMMLEEAGLRILSRSLVSADFDWLFYYRVSRRLLPLLHRMAGFLNGFPGYWMHEYVYLARKPD